ncbi:MAG: DNA-binding protein [Oscillospiraceae bacterium]|nr:DNA-binding protein [Oscillospiraceae bacterium]
MTLGVDTSNYTTSLARYDGETVRQIKRPLPVKAGELGLRQSDALFHHTVALPDMLDEFLRGQKVTAVGVSNRPRDVQGSYMPCFLAGMSVAQAVASALDIPLYMYSHQQGHLAAALYSVKRLDLLHGEFLAWHVSGGTTELLHVRPGLQAACIGGTADLNAGQLVDRVGAQLGLDFPAGPALDQLAQRGENQRVRVSVNGMHMHLSGVENQCKQIDDAPENIARFCLATIAQAMIKITSQTGDLPLICAGGVCCSQVLREIFCAAFPHAQFAAPEFSADNAAGIAVLAYFNHIKNLPRSD